MKDRQLDLHGDGGDLGDISPAIFREQLRRLADWIADYREHISERRISPNEKPGAVLAQLDPVAPEMLAPIDEIFSDIERVIVRQTGKLDWDYIRQQLRPLAELKGEPEILEELERRRIEFET